MRAALRPEPSVPLSQHHCRPPADIPVPSERPHRVLPDPGLVSAHLQPRPWPVRIPKVVNLTMPRFVEARLQVR